MQKKIFIIMTIATLTLLTFSVEAQTQKFSADALRADLDSIIVVMDDAHIDLYHDISKEKFAVELNKAKSQIKDSLTTSEFYKIYAPLFAMFNEGHLQCSFPSEFDQYFNNGGRLISLKINNIDERMIIVKSYENVQIINFELLTVNGKNVKALYEKWKKYFGGTEVWRNSTAAGNMSRMLWIENIPPPYKIEVREVGKTDLQTFTLNGLTLTELNYIRKISIQNEPLEFMMKANNIAYINFRRMNMNDYDSAMTTFLNKTFKEIKGKNAKGLIIDLRENGGGNSHYGELLMDYFNDKPYLMCASKTCKITDRYRSFFLTTYGKNNTALTAYPKNGIFVNTDSAKTPLPNALRYNGKVLILIGNNTFSSSNMLADGIRYTKRATLIGEETGECPNDYGETMATKMPTTKSTVYFSTALYSSASYPKTYKNRGIIPDITVKKTPEDRAKNIDTVMEKALEILE